MHHVCYCIAFIFKLSTSIMNFCSQMDGHQQCSWCGHVTGETKQLKRQTTRLVELKPCPWFAKMIKIYQNTSFLPHTLYSSILVKCVVCDTETLKQERPQEIGMVFVRTQKLITRSPAQSRGCKRSKELPVQQESRVPRHPW